jgi:peptidoglycan hydrolase-like protein with peptidoglycan-binding domain
VAALAVVAVAAGIAAFGVGGASSATQGDDSPLRTVEVTRTTLVDYLDVDGVIGFGDTAPLRYIGPTPPGPPDGLGLVTWLPAVGTTVTRGQPVLRVDGRPVVLLYGTIPLYRTLKPGIEGPDVAQLETNLQALGFGGVTVDQQYTEATATAVRRWQSSVALPPTGAVEPGQVLYAAGAVRVAEQRIHVGDVATGDILGYTGAVPSVSATIDATKLRGVVKSGTAVTVLVDGRDGPGTVERVAHPDTDGQSSSSIKFDVSVADTTLLAGREGAATIRIVQAERKDVLVVPVVALVALAEGGYGVQLADGRYVAVGTGLFARGMVEITSGEVTAGTKVVVPS